MLMYKELIKVSISLLNMAVSFCTAFHTCLGCCRLNSANDFLDIVSCIAAVLLSMTDDIFLILPTFDFLDSSHTAHSRFIRTIARI